LDVLGRGEPLQPLGIAVDGRDRMPGADQRVRDCRPDAAGRAIGWPELGADAVWLRG